MAEGYIWRGPFPSRQFLIFLAHPLLSLYLPLWEKCDHFSLLLQIPLQNSIFCYQIEFIPVLTRVLYFSTSYFGYLFLFPFRHHSPIHTYLWVAVWTVFDILSRPFWPFPL